MFVQISPTPSAGAAASATPTKDTNVLPSVTCAAALPWPLTRPAKHGTRLHLLISDSQTMMGAPKKLRHFRARSRSRTPAPGDKVSWLDTVRGTTQEGVGKAPKAPEQNQMVDNGIVYALRKEIVVMSELVQKLMQEMRERRRERTLAELTKQNEQPQVPVSIPHAHTPASKKTGGRTTARWRFREPDTSRN